MIRKIFAKLRPVLVTIALTVGALSLTTSAQAQLVESQGLLDRSIDELHLEGSNIGILLSSFSAQTKVPIGLEVSGFDDLSSAKTMRVHIKKGNVREALDSIVKQNPLYTWKVENEVVNVLPTDSNRDRLLRELLETKLERFAITRGLSRLGLRIALTKSPAVESVLSRENVHPDNSSFMSRDMVALGRDYMLEVSNVSVSELLNRIIRDSQTKYWIVLRHGTRKEYFVVNL